MTAPIEAIKMGPCVVQIVKAGIPVVQSGSPLSYPKKVRTDQGDPTCSRQGLSNTTP